MRGVVALFHICTFCQWISGGARLVGCRKCRDCVLSGMSTYMAVSAGIFMDVFRQWELWDSGSCLKTCWFQLGVTWLTRGGSEAVSQPTMYYFGKCNSITTKLQ